MQDRSEGREGGGGMEKGKATSHEVHDEKMEVLAGLPKMRLQPFVVMGNRWPVQEQLLKEALWVATYVWHRSSRAPIQRHWVAPKINTKQRKHWRKRFVLSLVF